MYIAHSQDVHPVLNWTRKWSLKSHWNTESCLLVFAEQPQIPPPLIEIQRFCEEIENTNKQESDGQV